MTINKKLIKHNYSSRNGDKIQYIVIHDTGNPRKGAGADAHFNYFNGANRRASAHYFVDDKEIIQTVEDFNTSWHCGDGKGKYGITNRNSIGIEICINEDSDYEKAVSSTIELVKTLMKRHNLSSDKVVRHFDVSRKICPRTMSENNWAKWNEFKEKLQIKEEVKDFRKEFIEEVLPGAKENFSKYGILPSLAIAQAILESGWGRSELATKSNNLFGIKAGNDWQGETVLHNTKEFINGRMVEVQAPFRKYNSKADSIKDHGKFLRYRKNGNKLRYEKVWQTSDYKQAVYEVWKAGYATDPKYVEKVVNVIETYNLQQYDNISWQERVGKYAIRELADMGIIETKEYWENKSMLESAQTWELLELVRKSVIREGKKS